MLQNNIPVLSLHNQQIMCSFEIEIIAGQSEARAIKIESEKPETKS